MVFHGRPSRDCSPCRRRKLRCNLDPTGCIQCRRAKLTCYGYRNPSDLNFRNETRTTTEKALARQAPTHLTATPQQSWDVMSRNAFLSLYIDRYSFGFDALGPLLAVSPTSSHLHTTLNAVGMAFMAFQVNRQDLALLASRRYLTAIQSLRTAIHLWGQSGEQAHQSIGDEFLQSVLLLDLYEKLVVHHQHEGIGFSASWLSHVQGALYMIKSRPSTDFSNPNTRHLASRAVTALTISCGAAGIPIPEALSTLRKDLDSYLRSSKWSFIGLLMDIVNLRAGMRNSTLSPIRILSRAQELKIRLEYAESRITRSWRPLRTFTENKMVFSHYYDVYPSHYIAQVFNAFRIMRLDMNGIIRSLAPCNSVDTDIATITFDICAATPQFLLAGARTENTLPFSPLQILECGGILTPLYIAAQSTKDALMGEWILQSMDYMAENGVKMASEVAKILRSSPETDYWRVFAMVGSCGITA